MSISLTLSKRVSVAQSATVLCDKTPGSSLARNQKVTCSILRLGTKELQGTVLQR